MKLVGCDVFIYHPEETAPDLPREVGPLKLELIANRGTKVWPTTAARLDYHGDEWRCRYTAADGKPLPNQLADINGLVKTLMDQNKSWTRVQVLWLLDDGSKGFSQPY